MVEVGEVLAQRGGTATFSDLLAVVTAHAVRKALAAGSVRRVAKGVYALPEAPSALTAARSQGGVVSHLSAAQHWGMGVISVPSLPHVTIPLDRARRRAGLPCVPHWGDSPAIDDVTTPVRTVLDCARTLSLTEGLAVADSALRLDLVDRDDLEAAAMRLTGPHRRRVQRVVALADHRAESVLESALRAILIDARIEGFEPQVVVRDEGFSARVDLGDRLRRIALEAEGFEFHGTRKALVNDCRRQVNLVLRDWLVLRFSWEDVMLDREWVIEAVREVLRRPPPINQDSLAA
ncbi:type IV toxin-antitoxin system AbiEi family antitoxin domain-containing protein [Kribbella lupini]